MLHKVPYTHTLEGILSLDQNFGSTRVGRLKNETLTAISAQLSVLQECNMTPNMLELNEDQEGMIHVRDGQEVK
jgi:hypothetical protein